MDGNGRWAQQHGLPRLAGHAEGAKATVRVVEECRRLGIRVVTLYALSSENVLRRPKEELQGLYELLSQYLDSQLPRMLEHGIRLETIGGLDALPVFLQDKLAEVKERTRGQREMRLVIALNYGARAEIARAAVSAARDCVQGKLRPEQLGDEAVFSRYLYTHGTPDPDMLIRTGGEYRISNFLLWQLAYTELFFIKQYWPAFTPELLHDALRDYQRRERRFGGLRPR